MRNASRPTSTATLCAALLVAAVASTASPRPAAAAVTCDADPTRTIYAGGRNVGHDTPAGACRQFDGNQAVCNLAFHLGQDGIASCFYDSAADECRGCGPVGNERAGDCTNTCATTVCAADRARTLFTGGPGSGHAPGACHQYDNNQGSCLQAFHRSTIGGFASCWYDAQSNQCRGCGPSNDGSGNCTNTCVTSPICQLDPSRTIFAGGPRTDACRQFNDDSSMCNQAYHLGGDEAYSSCYPTTRCVACGSGGKNAIAPGGGSAAGESNDGDATGCINSCVPLPTCADTSRTTYVGGPHTDACQSLDGNQAACNLAYHTGNHGVATCWYDVNSGSCNGCGPRNENSGNCTNTCDVPPTCLDSSRVSFLGGPFTGNSGGACRQAADQTACEAAYHKGFDDTAASCFWDGSECRGCGQANEDDATCTNTCQAPPTCAADPTRTNFALRLGGGNSGGACRQYDADQTTCNISFHRGDNGLFSSCAYDVQSNQCRGCGPEREGQGLCTNTCAAVPPCSLDATRTIFTGQPQSDGCHRFDGDSTSCAQAYVNGRFSLESCWYDAQQNQCRGCGPKNLTNGRCTNSCATATCPSDPTRQTVGDCSDILGNAAACNGTFELTLDGPISCFVEPVCLGCGVFNQGADECSNSCGDGPGSGTENGLCDDGVDNDGDNTIDCGDSDCAGDPACAAPAPALSWHGTLVALVLMCGIGLYQLRKRSPSLSR